MNNQSTYNKEEDILTSFAHCWIGEEGSLYPKTLFQPDPKETETIETKATLNINIFFIVQQKRNATN
jgi:hypothetical protein